MSSAGLKTLKDTLKRNSFDDAYYVCGEDDFQKEGATRQLISAALNPAMRDFNLDIRQAQDIDPRSFDAIVSSMPVMAERRMVVIRDAGALRKDARKAVERYLKKPAPDVLLLLVESTGGKTDKELARLTTVLEFELLSADRIPRWISHYTTAELKTSISPEAAELLQEAVGNDLYQLAAELDKLASFTNGREISEEAVTAVVGIRRGETLADLLDAIARRNIKQALMLVDHVLSQPKTTAVSIVMALATQTVALAWGRSRLDEGLPPARLQGEYLNLLKQLGSVYTGRPWSTAATAWASATSSWDQAGLQRALKALLAADVILKETRFSSEEQVLITLILAICSGDEHKIAA
jgi:DNA polymerase III subunit delta